MEHRGVFIFAEWTGERIHPVTYELLNEGRRLADLLEEPLGVIFLGPPEAEGEATDLGSYGADVVFLGLHEALASFRDDLYTELIIQILKEERPEIMLFSATSRGQALAPRVAGKMKLGLTAHCIAFEIRPEDKALVQIRPSFGENVMAKIISRTKPQMATVRPGVFSPASRQPGKKAELKSVAFPPALESALEVLSKRPRQRPETELVSAQVVVAGGRGLGNKELFDKLFELAELLEGAVGATRPVCHLGWISEDHMIGVSGHTVSPRLYLGFGISGALHHIVGLRNPGFIVAVNIDPEAPLMQKAHLAVVGDVREIIPLLIQRLKELKGSVTREER